MCPPVVETPTQSSVRKNHIVACIVIFAPIDPGLVVRFAVYLQYVLPVGNLMPVSSA